MQTDISISTKVFLHCIILSFFLPQNGHTLVSSVVINKIALLEYSPMLNLTGLMSQQELVNISNWSS